MKPRKPAGSGQPGSGSGSRGGDGRGGAKDARDARGAGGQGRKGKAPGENPQAGNFPGRKLYNEKSSGAFVPKPIRGKRPAKPGPSGLEPRGPVYDGQEFGGQHSPGQDTNWKGRPMPDRNPEAQPGWGTSKRAPMDRNPGGQRPGGGNSGRPAAGGQKPTGYGSAGQGSGVRPSKPALGQLMARYGVHLQPNTLDQLWAYHQLLRANNHDQDLTRLIGFDTMAQRHYADCMILHGMMKGKWPSPMVDVGTGAGFPGIMIKLMSPSTHIVLAEPRPRRVQFLEMVIRELGLKDISVFGHKVTSRSLTQPFAAAITRAFETVEHTLPRFGSCLGVGGKAIFMKGPKAAEEMAVFQSDEYKVLRNHAYRIPNTTQDRVLLILERTRVPEIDLSQPADPSEEADVAPQDPED
jgi:16S rRNA (guanine527-N7)-methyltransferase